MNIDTAIDKLNSFADLYTPQITKRDNGITDTIFYIVRCLRVRGVDEYGGDMEKDLLNVLNGLTHDNYYYDYTKGCLIAIEYAKNILPLLEEDN